MPARSSAARIACAPRSTGERSLSMPANRPIGVRTAEAIYTSCMRRFKVSAFSRPNLRKHPPDGALRLLQYDGDCNLIAVAHDTGRVNLQAFADIGDATRLAMHLDACRRRHEDLDVLASRTDAHGIARVVYCLDGSGDCETLVAICKLQDDQIDRRCCTARGQRGS